MSPVERTIKALREAGYVVGITQRSVPRTRHRPHGISIDLFGLADLEALAPQHTLYVQVCRDADFTDHMGKALASPHLARLVAPESRRVFEIWAWGKAGFRWRVKRWRALDAASFAIVAPPPSSQETPLDGVQTSAPEAR